jgi:hypothetical protein
LPKRRYGANDIEVLEGLKFCRIAVRSDGKIILGAQVGDVLKPGKVYEIRSYGEGEDCNMVLVEAGDSAANDPVMWSGVTWSRDANALIRGQNRYLLTREEMDEELKKYEQERRKGGKAQVR